ncbi:MAG TPA: ferredoxin reductase [Candidatus Limnocylindria bacterium]|nr:ferredoxin reductase [Candidatus Limnocylindria bacterium]
MARTALRGRLSWTPATVRDRVDETPRVRSLVLDCAGWPGHRPGQHVDIRLTAEDGYQAQRSYSIATPTNDARVTITVERIEDGEVSSYLVDELRIGDRIELRGPIGGYFVWEPGTGGPLLLAAGGSGIVPLMAMVRARQGSGDRTPIRFVQSWRSAVDIIYREELQASSGIDGIEVIQTLTRDAPPGWTGRAGRVDRALLEEVAWPPEETPLAFVCGPTGFVEAVASTLVELGHEPATIRTERFGPTGA